MNSLYNNVILHRGYGCKNLFGFPFNELIHSVNKYVGQGERFFIKFKNGYMFTCYEPNTWNYCEESR